MNDEINQSYEVQAENKEFQLMNVEGTENDKITSRPGSNGNMQASSADTRLSGPERGESD